MNEITVLDFENADIGKLALHLSTRLGGIPARAEPVALSAAGAIAYTGRGVLFGWSLTNTDAVNPNSVQLFDGSNANGSLIASDTLPLTSSDVRWLGLPGIRIDRGLFVTGSSTGTATLYLVRHPAGH